MWVDKKNMAKKSTSTWQYTYDVIFDLAQCCYFIFLVFYLLQNKYIIPTVCTVNQVTCLDQTGDASGAMCQHERIHVSFNRSAPPSAMTTRTNTSNILMRNDNAKTRDIVNTFMDVRIPCHINNQSGVLCNSSVIAPGKKWQCSYYSFFPTVITPIRLGQPSFEYATLGFGLVILCLSLVNIVYNGYQLRKLKDVSLKEGATSDDELQKDGFVSLDDATGKDVSPLSFNETTPLRAATTTYANKRRSHLAMTNHIPYY